MEDFASRIAEGNSFGAIYLDFREAFDSKQNKRLQLKKQIYDITGIFLIGWGFSEGKSAKGKSGRVFFKRNKCLGEIPQGSILGPILSTEQDLFA